MPGFGHDATATAGLGKRASMLRNATGESRLLRRPQHRDDREDEDLHVESQRPVLDVVVVPLDAVRERGLASQPVDLGPAGDARPDPQAVVVALDVALE